MDPRSAMAKLRELESWEIPILDTNSLSDAMGGRGVMRPHIRLLTPFHGQMLGIARTAWCPPNDYLTVLKLYEEIEEDEVIVIDGGGCTGGAILGELLSGKGQGAVIEGAVRDIAAIARRGYPVYAKAVVPRRGVGHQMGDSQIPISCGGVVVSPGDLILGDADGVIVISPCRVAEIMENARTVLERELSVKLRGEGVKRAYELNEGVNRTDLP